MKLGIRSLLMMAPTCIALVTASNALAAEDVTLEYGALSGENSYRTLTIAGELGVNSYDPGNPNSGWLWIKAHEIHLETSGSIDASGAGYPGDPDGAEGYGDGPGGTPQVPSSEAFPGGGGAHFGAGGPGNDGGCQPFLGAEGGTAYDTDSHNPLALSDPLTGMGSAGGTSCSGLPNEFLHAGGNGGGVIILEAGRIVLGGDLLADGEDGLNVLATAPGGGGGGSIIIRAAELEVADNAQLSARGGRGATSQTYGGSGGGGIIVVFNDDDLGTLVSDADAAGGPGNGICTVHPTAGEPGLAVQLAGPGCNDADGDGHTNELCGGDDCDDGDPDIHPERPDVCDLLDNDCDGEADEESDSPCPAGQICTDGTCTGTGGDGGSPPTGSSGDSALEDDDEGCSCSLAPASRIGPIALLLTLLGVGGLARRRRRR